MLREVVPVVWKSVAGLLLLSGGVAGAQTARPVTAYLTSADRSSVLTKRTAAVIWQPLQGPPAANAIKVDDSFTMQSVQGFGFSLTGGSAQLLHRMSPEKRHAVLEELFSRKGSGIGVSYLRVTIGASDLNDHVYTYDDMPSGKEDRALEHFTLREDEVDVIPLLREILAIAPGLRIVASPWTAPSWMKTNGEVKAGELGKQFYPVYAQYFVRYLQGMAAAGVKIQAITPQNEPLNANNTPSMIMNSSEEGAFIRDALGPALHEAGLSTEILIWDHNLDHPEYPLAILKDPKAAQYVTGSGWHLYEGEVSAMSRVHDAYPDKEIDFTEQMVIENRGSSVRQVAAPFERVVIGATRNWARTVLLWNLASDPELGPHTPNGGCPVCQGALTIDGDKVHRNIAYYTIAEIAKLVPPGSVRVASDGSGMGNVAFRTPDGKLVLFVANNTDKAQDVSLQWHGQALVESVPMGGILALVW